MITPLVPSTRRGRCQIVPGTGAFDIIISGQHRENAAVTLAPSQWQQPFAERVPVSVQRDGGLQLVGEGEPMVDRKGNLRIRGVWSATPLGEFVRTLVAQGKLRNALLQYSDNIDDAGNLVREVLGGVFILPAVPPRPADSGTHNEPASDLLGLAARIYSSTTPSEQAALADQVIICAIALGGHPG